MADDPLCLLLLSRPLESFILRDQAADLLRAEGVVAVEPPRIPYGALGRVPAAVAARLAHGQARRLRRAQSAVSYAIATLEDQLGVLLFDREGRTPTLTAAGKALFIPVGWTIIVCLIFFIVGHLVLTYTRFGRYVYMVGGNREAAEYAGVNVKLVIAAVMVISAVCAGIAGMLGVAYFGSAQQNQFDDFLLDSISAVVVGGTSLFGGRGGIPNTILGLLVLGVLNNGLDHIAIDPFLKVLIRGLILLAALIINVYAQVLKEKQADLD